MRKLKLSIEALQVESFQATGPEAPRGTVAGHAVTIYDDESCFESCNGGCTAYASCNGWCGSYSCPGTCYDTCRCVPTEYTRCDCQTWETCPGAGICA